MLNEFFAAAWTVIGQVAIISALSAAAGAIFLAILSWIYRDEPPDVGSGSVFAALFLTLIFWLMMALATWAERVESGADLIEIRDSETNFAEVSYSNGISSMSPGGTYWLTHNGVKVKVVIMVNVDGGSAERITVEPDQHFAAIPDQADVPDGETVTIQIVQPMF